MSAILINLPTHRSSSNLIDSPDIPTSTYQSNPPINNEFDINNSITNEDRESDQYSIFGNKFTLSFKKESTNLIYEKSLHKNVGVKLAYLIITFILAILCFVFFFVWKDYIIDNFFEKRFVIYLVFSLIIMGLCIVLFILRNKHIVVFKLYHFLIYLIVALLALLSKWVILSFYKKSAYEDYSYFQFTFFLVYQISYICYVDSDFVRIFVVNLIIIITGWIGFFITNYDDSVPINEKWLAIGILQFTISLFILTIFAYFFDKFKRYLFYLNTKILLQKNFYLNLLNSMQNGIFVYNIKKKKIKFVNNYLYKYEEFQDKKFLKKVNDKSELERERIVRLDNNSNMSDRKSHCEQNEHSDNSENFNIFNKIFHINKKLPKEVVDYIQYASFFDTINAFNSYLDQDNHDQENPITNHDQEGSTSFDNIPINENSSWLYIGQIKLKEKEQISLFEFNLRKLQIGESNYLEFMLNNVTYTKLLESEKTKQKTQILARISHEFKNPLIVTNEIIEEIGEMIKLNYIENKKFNIDDGIEKFEMVDECVKVSKSASLFGSLRFLKSLSQYMLLLVKDFEIISNVENKTKSTLYPSYINLYEFCNDIKEIVEALIKKKNSRIPLRFLITVDKDIDSFFTDSMRLKQILINLLSNSIKFTEVGYIELKIEQIQEKIESIEKFELENLLSNNLNECNIKRYIKFSVIDSGKGIPPKKRETLFTSLNNKDNCLENILGAGYGLAIVKNLCSMLNSNIEFNENNTGGSIFSFTLTELPIEQERITEIHFNNKINESYTLNNDTQLNNKNCKSCFIQNTHLDIISIKSPSNSVKERNINFDSQSLSFCHSKKIIGQSKIEGQEVKELNVDDKTYISTESIETRKQTFNPLKIIKLNSTLFMPQAHSQILDTNRLMSKYNNVIQSGLNAMSILNTICTRTRITERVSDTTNNLEKFPKFEARELMQNKLACKYLFIYFLANQNLIPLISRFENILNIGQSESKPNNKFEYIFQMSLKTYYLESNIELKHKTLSDTKINKRNIFVLLVDDEFIIRNAMKRLLTLELKEMDVVFVEANDGVELILAIYLASLNQIKFDFVITDENMNYINGSHAIEIIKVITQSGKFEDIPIFMSTALGKGIIDANSLSSDKVKKVFSKPMDKNNIKELLAICNIK